jgi:hypothetical protein
MDGRLVGMWIERSCRQRCGAGVKYGNGSPWLEVSLDNVSCPSNARLWSIVVYASKAAVSLRTGCKGRWRDGGQIAVCWRCVNV